MSVLLWFERNLRVANWTRGQGIAWQELPQSGVVRRSCPRDAWAARQVYKHANRKDRVGRSVNGRAPRRRKPASRGDGQIEVDF